MIKKLDKYLIVSFIGPFVAILLIVVFALLLQFLWLYIDELVGKGLGFKVIMEFLGWGAATMLPLSLPLATVLASMMTMGNLAENSELIALKSAGISLSRIMAPLIVTSFLLAIGAFFTANNLVPLSYNKIYTLRDDILRTKEEIKIPTKTFYDGMEGYILRVDSKNKRTGMMYSVMVYNHTSHNGNTSLTIADSAMLKISEDKSFVSFAMYNGVNYEEDNHHRGDALTRQLQRTEFARQELRIPLENYEFQKTDMGRYSSQAKAMRLGDLMQDQDSIKTSLDIQFTGQIVEMRKDQLMEYNRQLDTSIIRTDKSVFPIDSLPELKLKTNIEAHESAINRLNTFVSTLINFDRDTAGPSFTLKLIDLEIYKKFSLAIICFLLFFIGAPLGALIRKGGLGVPAIVSVLFFVLYYIVDIMGTKLARDGAIDPVSGAFIASYTIVPFCVFLTYKAIQDEPIFGNDKLLNFIAKIKIKLSQILHKTNIIYMGTPEFAVAPLKALLDNGYHVCAVVTVPDKPSGRGLQMNESAVKKFAVEKGIPVLQPEKMKDPGFIERLQSFKPDLFVVVAFRMLPREVWSIPKLGTFNLHAAMLPQYRGAAPINWAVINGERATGVTSFLIDDGIDTGIILMREQYRLKDNDTASDVHDELMGMGARVVLQTVQGLIEGHIDKRVQKSFIQGEEILHKAPKLTRELCHIDWDDTSAHIVNLIRGLSDYPAAFTELIAPDGNATTLKIFKATVGHNAVSGTTPTHPGTIFSDGKTWLGISTSDSMVLIEELQLAGKKRMNVADFLRGFHNPSEYSTSKGSSRETINSVHASEHNE